MVPISVHLVICSALVTSILVTQHANMKCIAGTGLFVIRICTILLPFRCAQCSLFYTFRFKHEPPLPWSAITISTAVAIIVLLVGHIIYATLNSLETAEHDYRVMRELKGQAEAADVAKSQVLFAFSCVFFYPLVVISCVLFSTFVV